MEHEQVEKMLAVDCLSAVLPRFGMEVSVGNHGISATKNILFPDDASIQIPAKVNEGLIAISDVFAVNNPFWWTTLRHVQVFIVSGLQKLSLEDLG